MRAAALAPRSARRPPFERPECRVGTQHQQKRSTQLCGACPRPTLPTSSTCGSRERQGVFYGPLLFPVSSWQMNANPSPASEGWRDSELQVHRMPQNEAGQAEWIRGLRPEEPQPKVQCPYRRDSQRLWPDYYSAFSSRSKQISYL